MTHLAALALTALIAAAAGGAIALTVAAVQRILGRWWR